MSSLINDLGLSQWEPTGSRVSGNGYGYAILKRVHPSDFVGFNSYAVALVWQGERRVVPCSTWNDADALGQRWCHIGHVANIRRQEWV